ncbi:MAG: biotin/lipoyl-containing protein, partial [Cyclobacteriaceae bacterium]
DLDGMRTVSFELNGQTRRILVRDRSFTEVRPVHRKASEAYEIGAPLQGRLANIKVKKGDKVAENDLLFIIEAMKMETSITAPNAGIVRRVHLKGGTMVEQDDLVIEFQSASN